MILSRSISTIFLIRPIGLSVEILEKYGFINAYIGDVDCENQYNCCVFLLFKPLDMDLFMDFIENERDLNSIIEEYDYSGGYVVIVYKFPNEFKNDYELVKKGLYSKTSKEFQKLFPKVIKIVKNGKHRDEISLQFRIFNRTQDLVNFWEDKIGYRFTKDQEVWEGFHLDRETLNIKKLKEN